MEEKGWSVLATYSSGLEADIAMGQLEQAGIPALRDNNNAVGIFGPGFQGRLCPGYPEVGLRHFSSKIQDVPDST